MFHLYNFCGSRFLEKLKARTHSVSKSNNNKDLENVFFSIYPIQVYVADSICLITQTPLLSIVKLVEPPTHAVSFLCKMLTSPFVEQFSKQ